MQRVIVMDEADNVATAIDELHPGEGIAWPGAGDRMVEVTEEIPFGHKIALTALAEGSAVIKYGEVVGTVTEAIASGAHVHVHNVASNRVNARERLDE